MASDDPSASTRRAPKLSIPLQPLSRSPDEAQGGQARQPTADSANRPSVLGNFGERARKGRYEKVLDDGFSRAGPSGSSLAVPSADVSDAAFHEEALSPIDPQAMSYAMTGWGGFDSAPPEPSPRGAGQRLASAGAGLHISPSFTPSAPLRSAFQTPPTTDTQIDRDGYFDTDFNDKSPLTDRRYIQPIDGAIDGTMDDDQDETPDQDYRPYPAAVALDKDEDHSASKRRRVLDRAMLPFEILRKMSQRVVNLSNEPEILEHQQQETNNARPSAAVMDRPPSFHSYTGYEHHDRTSSKSASVRAHERADFLAITRANPLRGHALGIFGPENWLRKWLLEVLAHPFTEQVIFILIILQLIALTIDAIPTLPYGQASTYFTSIPLTIAAVIVFGIYTLEIIAKCIVSGFIKNPHEYSTIRGWDSKKGSLIYRIRSAFQARLANTEQRKNLNTMTSLDSTDQYPIEQTNGTIYGHDREARKKRLAHRAFLRHSFNRLDFVAVVSFWISFLLSVFGVTQSRHVFVFQMLSCLRIIRLLGLTSGTTLILKSLKLAAPLLLRVAFLISFFWLIFGIIGVQSFQSSFRRTCLWLGPDNIGFYLNDTIMTANGPNTSIVSNFWNQNIAPANLQFCGGHIDPNTLQPAPYLNSMFEPNGLPNAKGFVCPLYSLCYENTTAIYNNTVSFDNILQSIELVFVVMSSNTFTDLLYYTTNTDNLQSSLFFIFGIIFLTFWMINLLVAVITHSFQVIRERGKPSTFTVDETPLEETEPEPESTSLVARIYEKTFWTWIVLIIVDLAALGSVTATMGPKQSAWILAIQIAVAVILAGEILFRMAAEGRFFWRRFVNWVDLLLVIITTVSTILQVFVSGQVFAWLTFFQIMRMYRVVLAIPMTRNLILRVLGNASGLLNLILFVLLATYLVAIFAVQLYRGEFPPWDASNNIIRFTFSNIYLAFIGMYQIFSSENWTVSMYNAQQFDYQFDTAWIAGAFFILWFLFANFIILNMFIAVIQENFDVSEDAKRFHQVRAFVQGDQTESAALVPGFSIASIWSRIWSGHGEFSRGRYNPVQMDVVKHEQLVKEFLDDQARKHEEAEIDETDLGSPSAMKKRRSSNFLQRWWAKVVNLWNRRTKNPFYARPAFVPEYDESFQWLKAAEAARDAKNRLKREQAQYLEDHPHYNDALFILSPSNPFRQLCQKSVGCGYGAERVAPSVDTDPRFAYPFAFVTYASIVTMVIMACIATPLYQLQYLKGKDPSFSDWFIWTDLLFAAIFTAEAIIKICADGFSFTPNAYYRGIWGKIDGIVLITLWISVAASLLRSDDVARVVGAFKALRALRLLNISKTARDTFYIVVVLGGWKVLSAAFVSICLLIPFAIFGLNLFRGQMLSCNDIYSPGLYYLSDCVGEWNSSPFQWNVTAPRQVANPYYNFDNFGNSLFVLFQIVSQEGWVDVMWSAMSIGGRGLQLQYYASQGNAVFFIVFNLLGAVFVLTLFISVFMRNHAEQTGNAFLTAEQRSWSELRLLLKQMKPNKRSEQKSRPRFAKFCYRLAIQKRGWWYFTVTLTLILHLILLVTEYFPMNPTWILVSDLIFLLFTGIYTINIVIRMVGLTPKRYFSSSWDIYSLIVVAGTLVTTALDLSQLEQDSAIRMFSTIRQFHELFLVAIVLLLIPRNNDLDQLFKTAAGAFTSIITLLATWLVLFMVFAIAMTQIFGLTKFGSQGQANLNFRTVPNALILLFRMSVGEGWNQIMADFADATTPLCHRGPNFFSTDCGSAAWANVLFISWNILSMYIFVSLFVSLIFESFSYVYQQSGETAAVSREETRRFKEAWSIFDPKGTKWIDVKDFPALMGELSGLFEMRIYESGSQFTLSNLKEQCQMEPRYTDMSKGIVEGLDLRKLDSMLNLIDLQKIQQRRKRLELFSREVLSLADSNRINFTDCLLTLAHWKVIKYNKALNLEEFLQLSAKRKLIEADINRERIVTFLDTFKRHREFRKRRSGQDSSVRLVNIPQFEVPEIYVDGDDELSPRKARFSASQDLGDMSFMQPPSPRSPKNNFLTLDDALSRSRAGSMQSTGQSSAHSRGYSFDDSGRSVMSVSRSASDAGRPSTSGASVLASGLSVSGRPSFEDRSSLAPSSSQLRHRRQKSSTGSMETGPKVENFEESAWGESIQRSFTKKRKKKTKSTKRKNEHTEV